MAKLIRLNRNNEYKYRDREMPLVVDVDLTMILHFEDITLCGYNKESKDFDKFNKKFLKLSKIERKQALTADIKDVELALNQRISCVGCRRSIETMLQDLKISGRPSLQPLVIGQKTLITIKEECMQSAHTLYPLLYVCSSDFINNLKNSQTSKKNKRCSLHSLDMHKSKVFGYVDLHPSNKSSVLTQSVIQSGWRDVWDVLSTDCKNEILMIHPNELLFTLDKYLQKHRFCLDCKGKVLRAFSILNGDVKPTIGCNQEPIDKGYKSKLYEHIKICGTEKHLHVVNNTELLSMLIKLATPDLIGSSRRERHAKTMDIAQDEVLTCLGIHLGERILKIRQKLKDEEQTWQLVNSICTEVLRKNFELAVEKKQGISNLELLCHELDLEEGQKKSRDQLRKSKKRKRKNAAKLAAKEQHSLQNLCACGNKIESNLDSHSSKHSAMPNSLVDPLELSPAPTSLPLTSLPPTSLPLNPLPVTSLLPNSLPPTSLPPTALPPTSPPTRPHTGGTTVPSVMCHQCKRAAEMIAQSARSRSISPAMDKPTENCEKEQLATTIKQDGGYASGPDSGSSASSAISYDSYTTSSDRLEEICSDTDCNCNKQYKEISQFGITSLQDMLLQATDTGDTLTEAELNAFKLENNAKELQLRRRQIRRKIKANFEDTIMFRCRDNSNNSK